MYSYYVFQIKTVYFKEMTDTSYKRSWFVQARMESGSPSNHIQFNNDDLKDGVDVLETWVYVEADNPYVARSLVYFYYKNSKDVLYIGKYVDLSSIKPPIHIFMDGYNKEIYEQFKVEYSYNFNE